ncbi:MAG: STAS domain-containing protein [Gammaproteobacteria bacterium]|nr:STAS domain-containing protein [Gammaproteobacteria bacterium]
MSTGPFALPCAIHFDNLAEVRSAGESYLDEQSDAAVFDLSGVSECNSVAVALLMAWVRYAHARNKTVVYADIPEDLSNIIDVSGLTETLPVQGPRVQQ